MYKYLLLIFTSLILVPTMIYGAEPCGDIGQYDCYIKRVDTLCKANTLPWMANKADLGPVKDSDYSELDAAKINSTISKIESIETGNPKSLQDGVSLDSLGADGGFRIIELARLTYRRNMNNIFSCAVLASRSAKLESILSINGDTSTELKRKVEKEKQKYDRLRREMRCDQGRETGKADGTIEKTMQSAMVEYCTYSYYLDYVGENVRNNISKISDIETKIGNNNQTKRATTTDGALRELTGRASVIDRERARAQDILPKAIRAFQEMDRTYIIHVMLTIIYDDYVTLRDQLADYLRLIGQTFEKAKGAQDARQR